MDVESTRARLVRALEDFAPGDESVEPCLRAAIGVATQTPGGLLRPILACEGALARGLGVRCAEEIACALEYFHVASLMLDDLPCMDDAEIRRGQPCVHRQFGDATAILASLSLISRAYALLGRALAGLPAAEQRECHALVDEALGARGLAGGQAADLRFSEGPRDARSASRIALRKTGGLFRAALLLPAIAAGAGPDQRRALTAVAVYWSLAYQALDDTRDLLSNQAITGKTTGRDRLLDRPNVALALGLPGSRRRTARLIRLAGLRLARLAASEPRCAFLLAFHREHFPSAADAVRAA